MGEDELRTSACGGDSQAWSRLVERVLARTRQSYGSVGAASGSLSARRSVVCASTVAELVLPLVAEGAIRIDVRGRRRPPVRNVDVLVPDLLEGCRDGQVVAQDAVDRLAIGAVGRIGLQGLGVEVLGAQRLAEREGVLM